MKRLTLLFLCILASTSLLSQKKSLWSFSSSNNLAFFSGNVNRFDLLSNNTIEHSDSTFDLSINYQYLYGEQSKTKYLLEHMASAFYDYHPHNKFSPWINTSILHNVYKGFNIRFNAATGIKYRFIYTPKQDWSISTGILYDLLNYAKPIETNLTARSPEDIWRLSIRPKIKIKLSKKARFKHITFYQPELRDFSNFIAWSQTELSVKVIEHLNLSVLYYYFYNNNPAYKNISRRDQQLLFGIKFTL